MHFGRTFSRLAIAALLLAARATADEPLTGPKTEARFPPLVVPDGFKATLFACDPLVEYPSAVALGPRPGTVFVAADFMTGLGTEIIRRDEIRLIADTDADGYADKATVYADGFNSIEGLTFHDGTVYVMHAPLLTALRDTDGDDRADERRELLTGVGLPPEENPVRLHCANGLVMGHDGWLYLALGDHGCDIPRPEGDRLVLHGGGILRCRADGADAHVFARGLRNIYDVALDDELNVFVRDNENDGGDYKIRVCHSFFGADHGYPYLYYERPAEALAPLADLGLGSSAGALVYRELQFPPEYRGNLFCCEWGKSIVRYPLARSAAGFDPVTEHEFATGAADDPYGFRPTDLVVELDGSLIVADWADGQRPNRGRGRIYRIAWTGHRNDDEPSNPTAVDLKAIHAVWEIAQRGGPESIEQLFQIAADDTDPHVQAQAIRALADLTDPALATNRLENVRGDEAIALRLANLAEGKAAIVRLEAIVALGRLGWRDAPDRIERLIALPDAALAVEAPFDAALIHAAMQTARRSGNWPAVLAWLDRPAGDPLWAIAAAAIGDQAAPELIDGLIARLQSAPDPTVRSHCAAALARVHRLPGPWTYWSYRPPPRPPNTIEWDRSEPIRLALDQALADPDRTVRLAALRGMEREQVTVSVAQLGRWLAEEDDDDRVTAILAAMAKFPALEVRDSLQAAVLDRTKSHSRRKAALLLFVDNLDDSHSGGLLSLAEKLEDGPVLAAALESLATRPTVESNPLFLVKLGSTDADVRRAAVEAAARLGIVESIAAIRQLLADETPAVRQAAASATGALLDGEAVQTLLQLAADQNPGVRRASLESLHALEEPRVAPLAVAALSAPETQMAALECLADLGGPEHLPPAIDVARRSSAGDVQVPVLRMLWRCGREVESGEALADTAISRLQGISGTLGLWHASGPMTHDAATRLAELLAAGEPPDDGLQPNERILFGAGPDARIHISSNEPAADASAWVAWTSFSTDDESKVQFLGGGNCGLRIWLDGRRVYARDAATPYVPDADRFDDFLGPTSHDVVILFSPARDPVEFHLHFRRQASTAEHEALVQAALAKPGDPARGKALFLNSEKTLCAKCHRLGAEGPRIGPELTGVGRRFSRVHLIDSILQPSRSIGPGFQTWTFVLADGRILTGLKLEETPERLTLGDREGRTHEVKPADVEERQPQSTSVMPDGLEKRLTSDEFVDLVAFLASQTDAQ